MIKSKNFLKVLIIFVLILIPCQTTFAKTNLTINSKGSEVKIVQEKLLKLNYPIKKVTGFYDKDTYLAVKEFQKNNNLPITGKVDDQTMSTLKKSNKKLTPSNTFSSSKGYAILETGKKYFGTPYLFGGTTPKGFDCSGFVQYVFNQNSIKLPRTADLQYKVGIKTNNPQVGDLVFFSTYEPGPSHCGIYAGNNTFLHVSAKKGVRIDSLNDPYWKPLYLGAKKVL